MSAHAYTLILSIIFVVCIFSACDNSTDANGHNDKLSSITNSSSSRDYPDSFKPDDTEYPYAGIPRIVIETEYRKKIKDRETEIPAKMQIWGDSTNESEIMNLTIRGRGNTSWFEMAKKGYKIEFEEKQSILGMPKDKDWALIANYADKTLIRNYIAYRLSATLNAYYAPRCEFAELYLNGEYLGVYLITETIKVAKGRVDIPKDDNSYIVEFDAKYKENEQIIFSDVITNNGNGKSFRVHDPKDANNSVLDTLLVHIQNFENFLKGIKAKEKNDINNWIDIDESTKHYWVQEFAKNPDGKFYTSVYFSWVKGGKIKMGPIWDFDLAFGNHTHKDFNLTEKWHIRNYWNQYLFKDSLYEQSILKKWKENHRLFEAVLDSVEKISKKIKPAAQNNFKRWDILGVSKNWLRKPYDSYEDAVTDLKEWISNRIKWIDSQNKSNDDK